MGNSSPADSRPAFLGAPAVVGSALGCALALVEQCVVPWILGESSIDGVGPVVRGTAGATTITLFGAAFVLAARCWPHAGRRPFRNFALRFLILLGVATLVLLHAASIVVRWFAGEFMSFGSIEFFAGSARHLSRLVIKEYRIETAAVAVLVALFTFIAFLGLERFRLGRSGSARWLQVGLGALLGLASLGGLAGLVRVQPAGRVSPEVAMWESIREEILSEAELESIVAEAPESNREAMRSRERPGPLQAEGVAWRAALPALAADADAPNVLLIMLESVGIDHLGYEGYERATTPNLDQLAARGMVAPLSWTTATHSNYAQMAILSSLFPRRTVGLDVYEKIDYPRVLFHDVFHQLGYRTATISSQDETWQGMIRFESTGTPTDFFHAADHRGPFVDTGSERVVPDRFTAERAIRWIAKSRPNPWALYVNLQMTHFPYKTPQGYRGRYQPSTPLHRYNYLRYAQDDRRRIVNRYDNALRYVDAQIGRIYRGLSTLKELDDTIIVVTADHGELFGQHGLVTHGRSLFEGEARIPMIFFWPAKLRPGTYDEPASHLDILPTVLGLLGVEPHPAFQGRDLFAKNDERRAVLMNIQGMRSAEGIVCWPWKFTRQGSEAALFDLVRDPGELADRVDSEVEVAGSLQELLDAHIRAQMRYHADGSVDKQERFAPRLPSCPVWFTRPERELRAEKNAAASAPPVPTSPGGELVPRAEAALRGRPTTVAPASQHAL